MSGLLLYGLLRRTVDARRAAARIRLTQLARAGWTIDQPPTVRSGGQAGLFEVLDRLRGPVDLSGDVLEIACGAGASAPLSPVLRDVSDMEVVTADELRGAVAMEGDAVFRLDGQGLLR